MRFLIQRVSSASVTVENEVVGSIKKGLLVLVGIEETDAQNDLDWLISKTLNLRIFNDEMGVMNESLEDVSGQLLLVSQFTLMANCKKGNRPSYTRALHPAKAEPLFEKLIEQFRAATSLEIETGKFGAQMNVELENDGPVTILLDSKNKSNE